MFARVDEVEVFIALGGFGAHAEQAVFAVQKDFFAGRQMIGHQRGQADAEVHVSTFRNVLGHTGGHMIAVEFLHGQLPTRVVAAISDTLTTRCTKMPGVTMCSGSSAPSSTMWRTAATVVLAAIAIAGPKLRAVLR